VEKGMLNSDSKNSETKRQDGEYVFCTVLIPKIRKPYYYLTEDETISIGDKVIVPFGFENSERIGTVTDIDFLTPEDMPYNIYEMNFIVGKVNI
jgi:hypothetical protein